MSRFRCVAFTLLTLVVLSGCDYLPNSVPPHEAHASAKVQLSDSADQPNG